MSESCRLCQDGPFDDVAVTDSIPLCIRHWNWWVLRYLHSDDLPPCGAHVIEATS